MKRKTLYTTLAILLSVFLTSGSLFAENKNVTLKNGKSKLEWLGKKVTGEHFGHIAITTGKLGLKDGKLQNGSFVVDMTSIVCTDIKAEKHRKKLEGHLKSDDFFGVEKFPKATFKITNVSDLGDGNYKVTGDMTIKGITKAIDFNVNLHEHDELIHVSGKIVIDRSKFNVRYGSGSFFDNLGDKTIYDDFELSLDLYLE